MINDDLVAHIIEYDRYLFTLINGASGNPLLDAFMIAASSHSIWLIIIGVWVWSCVQRGYKNWPLIIVMLAFAVGLSDLFAFEVLKPYFGRSRPCKIGDAVNIVHSCGGQFSFPSNHATNSMVAASLMFWWAGRKFAFCFLGFAALVGFSRIYLGVHYPLDILVGSILGFSWGRVIYHACKGNHWLTERIKGAF